jgi:hypothetical protein
MDERCLVTDFLLSADLMVPDPDAHTQLLVDKLGIHAHPNWRQGFETHAYIAHFLRVHKSLAVAPTRLEPQHHFDRPNVADPAFPTHLASLDRFQGIHRPIKTHSCVIATDNIHDVIERLSRRRLPFRIAPMDKEMGWERLWVGMTPEDPRYSPEVDGGLCLEWIPIWPLQMPPETFADPPPEPRDPAPGENIRIVSRSFIVRDLDDVLRRLSTNLGWEPLGPVEQFDDEGFRRARLGFTVTHSAIVEVIEPTRWNSTTGYYLNTWGPGPCDIRIAVNGLEPKAADLEARGTRFSRIEECESVGPRLRVDPDDLEGTLIEFVDYG